MKTTDFQIPEEFRSDVHQVESHANRSEGDILKSLTQYAPVVSEKNIWTYWHAGLEAMPAWCQRNIVNWVRLCGPEWSVHVLDDVTGSPNNALTWIEKSQLPEAFVNGTMDGPYVGPHSADFLRGISLFNHGGVWMDVGIILVRSIDDICWKQLEDPNSPFQISAPWMYENVINNHFVASRKGDPFIKRWHDLFVELWKDRTNHGGIIQNPLVDFAKSLDFSASQDKDYHWEFKVEPVVVFEYIAQILSWLRVTMLEEPNGGFNGAEYWSSKVLLFNSLPENWSAEATIGFNGQQLFDVLATKLDADPESEEYQKAYKTVWRVLTRSSMQKVTHGKNLTKGEALGVLWDKKGNEEKDSEPGTFAELLRYGSVHFEQNRKEIEYVAAVKPKTILKKGLLEP